MSISCHVLELGFIQIYTFENWIYTLSEGGKHK